VISDFSPEVEKWIFLQIRKKYIANCPKYGRSTKKDGLVIIRHTKLTFTIAYLNLS